MNDELSQIVAKLRADYAEQLPATFTKMENLWRGLAAEELPVSGVVELTRMAHSITGAGTTFGLPAVSRAARDLELFLDPFSASGRLPSGAERETVSVLLVALRQSAALP